jgi:MFS family permease
MGEGAVYDWSAIYLKDTLLANAFYSGLGYAGFSMTMSLGRFYGDLAIHRWGPKKTVIWGAILSLAGVLVSLILPDPWIVIAGFTIAGAGFSCLIPSIYISASRMPGGSAGSNLAAVASLGYFGLLAGPPFIGMIADHFGLRTGLGIVVILMGIVVLLSRKARFS